VLLKEPVKPTDFFDEHYNQVLFETEIVINTKLYIQFNTLDEYFKSIVLSSQLLDSIWNEKKDRIKSDHGVQVFDRKILLQMHKELGTEMDLASLHKTRVNYDPQLAFIYNEFVKKYTKKWKAVKGFNYYGGVTTNFAQVRVALQDAYRSKAKVLCLNDGLKGTSKYFKDVIYELTNFYESMLPARAPWEKEELSDYIE